MRRASGPTPSRWTSTTCSTAWTTRRFTGRSASSSPSSARRPSCAWTASDPSKNIATGFQAFEHLLDRYPQWRGQVRFLAFLVPTRTSIAEYQRHAKDVLEQAEAINARFGDATWKPIEVHYEQDRMQGLAALSLYDVLLVNSVVDGLNLVSKEGAVVNQRDGVLVLSRGVGSYQELKDYALGIDPLDVAQTASVLNDALSMPFPERRRARRRPAFGHRRPSVQPLAQPHAGRRAGALRPEPLRRAGCRRLRWP